MACSETNILIATEDYPSPLDERILGTVRADYCVPIDKGIFYFEVEVMECGPGKYATLTRSSLSSLLCLYSILHDIVLFYIN